MTARVFRKIFAITDPASNILQSEKIDLLIAVRLVETAEGQLCQLRSGFKKVLAETKEYCSRHNLVQQDFPAKRVRRRKKASDELSNGEIEQNQTAKYRWETFIYSNDKASSSIKTPFSRHKTILYEFALPYSPRLSLLMASQRMHSTMWPATTVSVHSI